MADREEIERKLAMMAEGTEIILVSTSGARYRGVRIQPREVDSPDDVVVRRKHQTIALSVDSLRDVEFA